VGKSQKRELRMTKQKVPGKINGRRRPRILVEESSCCEQNQTPMAFGKDRNRVWGRGAKFGPWKGFNEKEKREQNSNVLTRKKLTMTDQRKNQEAKTMKGLRANGLNKGTDKGEQASRSKRLARREQQHADNPRWRKLSGGHGAL